MGSLIVIAVAATLAFVWIRGTRRNRTRWLARLDLPGTWKRDGSSGRLELSGKPDRGSYRLTEGDGSAGHQGRWSLEGHTLHFTLESGEELRCDLRFFQEGKIGIDGPRMGQRIYQKVPSNVVPLRGHSGS